MPVLPMHPWSGGKLAACSDVFVNWISKEVKKPGGTGYLLLKSSSFLKIKREETNE
jgi:hypothetical protein